MNQPDAIYYRAREDQTVNDLPIFFGHLEFHEDKVRGKHYRVNVDPSDCSYLIGYYWLELEAEEFRRRFEANHLIELTPRNFDELLSKWTLDGARPVYCWNPEKSYEAKEVWGVAAGPLPG